MALSRERIADELLKLLAVAAPGPTVAVMLEHGILNPVLPEIDPGAGLRLKALVSAERQAGIDGDPLRRLAALLPSDPGLAESIAVRLKLSNKARKRLACAAEPGRPADARAVAYYDGADCAIDRLLLAGEAGVAAGLADWQTPKLPISGGTLIERGLARGPVVAKTLQAIERRWVETGFPGGSDFERIVEEALGTA
jgi:poly(A) polymerase